MDVLAAGFERAPVGLAIADATATLLYANTAFAEMLGYSAEEARGKTIADLNHPEALQVSLANVARMRSGEADSYEMTKRYVHKHGHDVWIRLQVTWLFGRTDGRFLVQAENITAEQISREALSASEQRLREMAEAIDQAFWIYNLNPFRLLYSSPAGTRVWGFDPMVDAGESGTSELRMFATVHPDDMPVFVELVEGMANAALEREFRLKRPDGEIRWVRVRAFPIRDALGRPQRVAGVTEDITERKNTAQQLERYQELKHLITEFSTEFVNLSTDRLDSTFVAALTALSQVAGAAGAGVWLLDPTGTQLELGWHWVRPDLGAPRFTCLPYPSTAVPPQFEHGTAVVHAIADMPEQFAVARDALADQGFRSFLYAPLIAGGKFLGALAFASTKERTWSEEMASLLAIAGGMFANVIERIRAELAVQRHRDQLAHVLRLKTMGQLASGIAHELNQPLGAILTYARGCARRIAGGATDLAEIQGALNRIGEQAVRAADVIRMLRALVKAETHRARGDINAIIREALTLVQPDLNANGIRVTFIETRVPEVEVDAIQIEQVLLNLVRNACDALVGVPREEREIWIESRSSDAGGEVIVRDNGPGIPAADAVKIFDEFFTTRAEGLGLGLPISRSILEAHGGRLWLDTSMVPGACFRFTLPAASAV